MLRKTAILVLATSCLTAMCQTNEPVVSNADVISMAKAGISEDTIILSIQRGPTSFETSPQALIAMKKAGLSDKVLRAMLDAPQKAATAQPGVRLAQQPPANTSVTSAVRKDAQALFEQALNSIGAENLIRQVKSIRRQAEVVRTSQGSDTRFSRETTRILPEKMAVVDTMDGRSETTVATPDFGYVTKGEATSEMPWVNVVDTLQFLRIDPLYVAQQPYDFDVEFACEVQGPEGISCNQIRITHIVSHAKAVWLIGPEGSILSVRTESPLPKQQVNYSDYRSVEGIQLPFHLIRTSGEERTEITVRQYEINPSIDASLFTKPEFSPPPSSRPTSANSPSLAAGPTGLSFRVLQEKSVPYTQEFNGGASTTCSIVGGSNTTVSATAFGNSAYGQANTSFNQQMSCNSYDTTIRWPHILNVMFVEASNGNSYIIGCDRAWRWSKCVPLRVGDVFSAHFTNKGVEVSAVSPKGKDESLTYQILQSAVAR